MKKNIKFAIIFGVGMLLVVLFSSVLFQNPQPVTEETESVTVKKDGTELVVSRDGSVVYRNDAGVFFDTWDSEKTNTFFDYFDETYSGSSDASGANTVTVKKGSSTYTYSLVDDEIANLAGEDAQEPDNDTNTGGTGGTGGVGGGTTTTNTPLPTSTSTPTNPGGPECLYWKLSYCVVKRTPTPTPSATGTADPNANVIQAANCDEYLTGGGSQAVINNTLCITEE